MPGFLDFKPYPDRHHRDRLIREARWRGHSGDYQTALAQVLARSNPDFYVNLHFNNPVQLSWALRCIKMAWGQLERQYLGRNYYRSLDRCTGVIILENLESNEHANILPKMASPMREFAANDFRDALLPIWKRVVSKGSVHVERFYRERGERPWESRLSQYVVKQVRPGEVAERVFWLQDFWPADLAYRKFDRMKAKEEEEKRCKD